ncbi:hypothetical protein Daesc_006796 [Daldinia eschscholtzii]|uniref:Protein FYV4, mitochondrial n=1 Tax=Daldinia eschscholtzii TaxID=292717 RepID=A0AAX6MJA5_9PEZI
MVRIKRPPQPRPAAPPKSPPPDALHPGRRDLPHRHRPRPQPARLQVPHLGGPLLPNLRPAARARHRAPRTRRYLLQWRQRFLKGQYGIGGDLQHVEDGKADLKILESDADPVRPRKYVVNVPAGRTVKECGLDDMSRVRGYKVDGAKTIVGPYALPLKGGEGARVTITEGMWEDRRGHKVDGGERRRTEIRYKKRIAERREMRERGEL